MTDIVPRLRDWLDEETPISVIMNEAADAIAALRAENERLKLEARAQYAEGLHDGRDRAGDEWEKEVSALRAENASLSAWQCVYTDGKTGLVGDEHGNQYCAMAKRVDALRAENERLRAALQRFCDRVEAGEVKSKHTYAEFKALLKQEGGE